MITQEQAIPNHASETDHKLVDAHGLLEALFDENSRPSLRYIRKMQAQRRIPYIKLGHLVRFDVDEVREALRQDWTVRSRSKFRK